MGVIYILTNPSFSNYVKIGYADDVKQRVAQLNHSECTPFGFRIYATYETKERLTDLKLHSVIDALNPNLRSIDNIDGKVRVREFYEMSAEEAYSIFEAIAEISDTQDKLKLYNPSKQEAHEERVAKEVAEIVSKRKRLSLSSVKFSNIGIKKGDELTLKKDSSIKVKVVDTENDKVMYENETYSLSAIACSLLNYNVNGNDVFTFKGETIHNLKKQYYDEHIVNDNMEHNVNWNFTFSSSLTGKEYDVREKENNLLGVYDHITGAEIPSFSNPSKRQITKVALEDLGYEVGDLCLSDHLRMLRKHINQE